jgi:glycosyltransferase involved in cell wall biosynthesis
MVGPDTQDGTLQLTVKLADDLSVSQHLRMLGPIPKANVPECLAEADIFLNTADIDNAPVTIVEAMACGLCIISTSVGGIPYLLRDGHDALLVPPNDPEAMAAAVRRILKEPGLAKILSRNARRKAEEFSWSNILPQWEELLLNAGNRDA